MIKEIDLIVKRRSASRRTDVAGGSTFPSTHHGIKEIISGEVGGLAGRAHREINPSPYLDSRSGGGLTSGAACSCSIRRDLEQA